MGRRHLAVIFGSLYPARASAGGAPAQPLAVAVTTVGGNRAGKGRAGKAREGPGRAWKAPRREPVVALGVWGRRVAGL